MLSQAVRLTLRTTIATGFSQAVATDLDDGKIMHGMQGVSGSNPLGSIEISRFKTHS